MSSGIMLQTAFHSLGPVRAATAAPLPIARTRLPELSLRPFSGELIEWSTFWDSYKAAVRDNTSISDR